MGETLPSRTESARLRTRDAERQHRVAERPHDVGKRQSADAHRQFAFSTARAACRCATREVRWRAVLFGLTFLKETLPMEFALLGEDAVATSLVRAIGDCAEHGIVRGEAEWEQLLVDDAVDAVIVAGCEQDVLDGAKQLAAAGVPLLVVPHIGQGAGWVYELTLARDDSGVVLMPAFPDVDDPALTTLGGLLAEAALAS